METSFSLLKQIELVPQPAQGHEVVHNRYTKG